MRCKWTSWFSFHGWQMLEELFHLSKKSKWATWEEVYAVSRCVTQTWTSTCYQMCLIKGFFKTYLRCNREQKESNTSESYTLWLCALIQVQWMPSRHEELLISKAISSDSWCIQKNSHYDECISKSSYSYFKVTRTGRKTFPSVKEKLQIRTWEQRQRKTWERIRIREEENHERERLVQKWTIY